MILECPSCQNRYLVDPRAIGAKGRTVRCAKCRYEWFAEPPREEPQEDVLSVEDVAERELPPIPEGSSVPAIPAAAQAVPAGLRYATFALAALCCISAALFFHRGIVGAIPALEGAYAAIGFYSSEGVVFADLEYEKSEPTGEKQFKDTHTFKGMMVNTSAKSRKMPVILLTLQGKDGVLLRRQPLIGKGEMAPGGTQSFSVPLTTSPESLRHAIIELGSPQEIRTR